MSLIPVNEMMADARQKGYAVGYFESWDIASLEGVISAAEQARSPIIIGFNGEFLSNSNIDKQVCLNMHGALGRAAAESARVPCAFVFNECPLDSWVEYATRAGFNLVMPADAGATHDDLTRRVADLTRISHSRGVAVEAELGVLPCNVAGHSEGDGSLTDPDQAAAFVDKTGVDLLAVSIGNEHLMLKGQCDLKLEHLESIRRKVDVPLVLHGGSGMANGSLAHAISMGVTKVNYGTYIKQRCLKALRLALAGDNADPHQLLGYGGDADLMVVTRRTVRDAVLERIDSLGSCGKA